ncbi:hypothetical protein KFL_002650010 [Klebsormidium nitens]|uniref:Uncharacterized protein n=1 Tax=Klebsormidium nitens TaxID=105231 RepID=A0A1Y1I4X5_KLENI|nr:hypothetical protein KFL_002650010 [Klebsormidium nitens]|eukprot:GAQ86005.1 hypothetical protein KFL_002650010 [Klebsormidium nitens]
MLLLTAADARVFDVSSGLILDTVSGQSIRAGVISSTGSGLVAYLGNWQRSSQQAKDNLKLPRRNLLQVSGNSGDLALKVGFGVASSLFAGLVAAATWASFAYRYRSRKQVIIRAAIMACTDRDEDPTLPNPQHYLVEDRRRDLRNLLKQVMGEWDSRLGCSPRLSFPVGAELGIWRREFYGRESVILVEALQHVDAGFCSTDGYDGLLDRWRKEPTIPARSFIASRVCNYVERRDKT